ncbi:MAG: hypothetical protein IT427_15525 [Pirellulales bacterium]|nr:hypothetical protein [Pirellulales bacterium]
MGSRWFNSVVVLFWLSTMTWLVVAKVVPPLQRGDPPNYQSMYSRSGNDQGDDEPVAWDLTLNGKPLGWAVSKLVHIGTGVTEVRGRIHFDRIPLQEFSPTWTRILMEAIAIPVEGTQMDVFSSLEIDPLGHLTRFRSALRVTGMREAVVITGKALASRLEISVESGQLQSPKYEVYLPRDALVADELSPQSRITGLRLNQEWTVPVFSPLRPPKSPVEILQAKVESRQPFEWEGKVSGTYEVVYRSDSGSVLFSSREPRARLWVRDDGTVLKQEVNILGSRLVFTRLSDERSSDISHQAERDDEDHRRLRREQFDRWRAEHGDDPAFRRGWYRDSLRGQHGGWWNRQDRWQRRGDADNAQPPLPTDAPVPATEQKPNEPPATESGLEPQQDQRQSSHRAVDNRGQWTKEEATPARV